MSRRYVRHSARLLRAAASAAIPGDQVAVFLHAGLIVAGDVVEQAARAVPLALGHAVEMADGFLDVLLGVLLLVQVARRDGHAGVAEAEVRIQRDRLREALAARRRTCCRTWPPSPPRTRGRRRATWPTAFPSRNAAPSRTCRRRAPRERASASFVATPRTWSLLDARFVAAAMTLPVTACVAFTDTRVAAALSVDRAGQDDADALLDGELLRGLLVQASRAAARRGCGGSRSRSYALMKPAPSSASFSIGSSVRSNVGSPVPFWKSAITTDTGSCATGTARPAARATRSGRAARRTPRPHGGGEPPRHAPHDRKQLCRRSSSRFERRDQLRRGLEARGRVGLEALRHEAIERLGNAGIDRARRRWRRCMRCVQLRDRGVRVRAPARPSSMS